MNKTTAVVLMGVWAAATTPVWSAGVSVERATYAIAADGSVVLGSATETPGAPSMASPGTSRVETPPAPPAPFGEASVTSAPQPEAVVEAPPASAPAPSPEPRQTVYVLRAGDRISRAIRTWLQQEGWTLRWGLTQDWETVADTEFQADDALGALDELAKVLTAEGRPIQFVAYEGNRIVEAQPLSALKR